MVTDRRELITQLVDLGCPLGQIEQELIDRAAGLDDDERAALWLYAWSYSQTRGRGPVLSPAGGDLAATHG